MSLTEKILAGMAILFSILSMVDRFRLLRAREENERLKKALEYAIPHRDSHGRFVKHGEEL